VLAYIVAPPLINVLDPAVLFPSVPEAVHGVTVKVVDGVGLMVDVPVMVGETVFVPVFEGVIVGVSEIISVCVAVNVAVPV
jgi:hypothetical protein